jgi:hypothetical protein
MAMCVVCNKVSVPNPGDTCLPCQIAKTKAGFKKAAPMQAPVVQTAPQLEYRAVGSLAWIKVDPVKHAIIRKGTQIEVRLVQGQQALAPMWQGTSGGNPERARFDTASTAANDFKEVKATHNTVTYTLKALVFNLVATMTPQDNIGGNHSANSLGVNEKVDLGFTLTPGGVSTADIGGLTWEVLSALGAKISGGRAFEGKLEPQATQGNARFQAPYRTETSINPGLTVSTKDRAIKLRLKMTKGFVKDDHLDLDITVKTPRAHMKIDAGRPHGGIIHKQNMASAGFFGLMYLFPKDVSFKWIRWQEQFGTSSFTGNWPWKSAGLDGIERASIEQHQATSKTAGSDIEVLDGDINIGCKVDGGDNVWSKGKPSQPHTAPDALQGTMDWRILWQYRPDDLQTEPAPHTNVSTWVTFQVMHHRATLYSNGRVIVSKKCEECEAGGGVNECNGLADRTMNAADDNVSDL